MIQAGDTYVIALDKRDPNGTGFEEPIDPALVAVADTFVNPVYVQANSPFYFNGDDAVPLIKNGNELIDLVGRIGEDPGTAWSDANGVWWTVNHTLVRKPSVQIGDSDGLNVFWPEAEWDSLPINTFSNLGHHTCDCFVAPPVCPNPPSVLFAGLNTNYNVSDGAVTLVGAPSGGTFFGNGISGNQFDPSIAGLGSHGVTYVYVDNNDCMNAYSLCTTVDLNVGIGGTETSSTERLDVYPNPSADNFNLSIGEAYGIVSYTVYDARGREVGYDSFVASGAVNKTINLKQMVDGVYTIQVVTSAGTFSQKLIRE